MELARLFSDSPEILFCDSVTIILKVLQKKMIIKNLTIKYFNTFICSFVASIILHKKEPLHCNRDNLVQSTPGQPTQK